MRIEGDPAAKFNSIEESVEDLFLWLSFNKLPFVYQSPDEYVRAIKSKGYFEDSLFNYLTAVKAWLQTVQV